MIENSLIADRGGIYTWSGGVNNPKATFTHCLVISDDSRASDAIISVLFLYNGLGKGIDSVDFTVDGVKYHVHAEMVTYTGRNLLSKKVMQLPEDKMNKVDSIMRKGLGLDADDGVYKELYDDLVGRIVKGA